MNETFVQRAYGRVNLIGEHTDYNGGWVLPTAIAQFTEVTLKQRNDKKVILHSSRQREYTYELGQEVPSHDWTDYLKGATKLLNKFTQEKAERFNGFEATIESTIPEGSGLSSSAALEVSFMKAIRLAYHLNVSDVELALIGQRIENEFVGAHVGIMDQMACSLATFHTAVFLDTKNLTYEQIELPYDQMDLLVINSGISHQLSAKGGYNERRAQCEEASKLLGIKLLRDISLPELITKKLPDILMKRARHVVSENQRVHLAVKAIKNKDLNSLGQLFIDSHHSMRDDYEVSIPEIDFLVELTLAQSDTFGARLTGGGFGGSIVAITKKGKALEVANSILPLYEKQTKKKATILS